MVVTRPSEGTGRLRSRKIGRGEWGRDRSRATSVEKMGTAGRSAGRRRDRRGAACVGREPTPHTDALNDLCRRTLPS